MRHLCWCMVPAICVAGLMGCATPGFVYDMLPPVYEYSSRLVPGTQPGGGPNHTINEDGSITYDHEGLRITARAVSDAELNERYPDISYQGRFSANPFTYGNWRDPDLGYTPTRFTVFEIDVFNPVLPKVELFPSQAVLRTNRGEEYTFYSVNLEESDNSFEEYYTLMRGPGGNEQYRFDQRMGIVREQLYRPDHRVFKGGDYGGYLVFGPLEEGVASAELRFDGIAIQFDEADNPSRRIDVSFGFDLRTGKRQLQGEEARRARRRDWVLPRSARK